MGDAILSVYESSLGAECQSLKLVVEFSRPRSVEIRLHPGFRVSKGKTAILSEFCGTWKTYKFNVFLRQWSMKDVNLTHAHTLISNRNSHIDQQNN